MKKIMVPFLLIGIINYVNAKTYNVTDLGADAKGVITCTEVIEKAINNASKEGGGTIYFPTGKYKTGAIHLKSNITLYLEAGSVLSFSDNFDDFLPFVRVRYEGVFMNSFSPLIYAENCQNISITGKGELIGNGKKWWDEYSRIREEIKDHESVYELSKYQKIWEDENKEFIPVDSFQKTAKLKFFRPAFIQFVECQNITIENITIKDSPFWTVNPVGCEDINIRGIRVFNPEKGPNTDGINPSSCKNVRISDCYISVGDDCITIKSGKDKEGRTYGRPCENIAITNCVMEAGHGGVVIGSEMSGGIKNVVISNCVFDGTDNGIRLKTARGRGGVVENIIVNNIVMTNIQRNAFIFNMFYDKKSVPEKVSERTPMFRNIHISNIIGTDLESAGFLLGLEEMPVSDISFNNLHLQATTGFSINKASNIRFSNVEITTTKGPSIEFSDCSSITIENVNPPTSLPQRSVFSFNNCKEVLLSGFYPDGTHENYYQSSNSDIIFNNCKINSFR